MKTRLLLATSVWFLCVMGSAFLSMTTVWAQEGSESFLQEEKVVFQDAGPIDPSVFLGNWETSFSGGKTLTPDGKNKRFSEKIYFKFSGNPVIHDDGEYRLTLIDGEMFEDEEQQLRIASAGLSLIEAGGKHVVHITVYVYKDDITYLCCYNITGYLFPPARRGKVQINDHINAELSLVCGPVYENIHLIEDKVSSAFGRLTKY